MYFTLFDFPDSQYQNALIGLLRLNLTIDAKVFFILYVLCQKLILL